VGKLELTYWTNRWGSTTTLGLEKTKEGWIFHAMAHSGQTDSFGMPHLIGNFHQDYVAFPDGVGNFLHFIHTQITNGAIDEDRAQEMLNQLGDWISECERSTPKWSGWN